MNKANNVNKGTNFNIEFIFDPGVKCSITIYYFCVEDLEPTCTTNHTRDSSLTSATFHYKRVCQPDLTYSSDRDVYPIEIHCFVEEGYEDICQSHTTICGVDHHSDETYVPMYET